MSYRTRLYSHPFLVAAALIAVVMSVALCQKNRLIQHQIILTDDYIENLAHTFSIGAGCEENKFTRQVAIDRRISLQYAKDNPLSIPEQIVQEAFGEIYGKLRTQENLSFGQVDTYTVEMKNNCLVPRICYITEKSRHGIIKFTADDKTTTEANFSVPVSTDVKCLEKK